MLWVGVLVNTNTPRAPSSMAPMFGAMIGESMVQALDLFLQTLCLCVVLWVYERLKRVKTPLRFVYLSIEPIPFFTVHLNAALVFAWSS